MRHLTKLLFVVFITSLITACENTAAPDPIQVLGTPPPVAYFDVYYEATLGADGGDGLLNYRLVTAPEWLKIETINGANPSFKIFGTPVISDREEFDNYENKDEIIEIEVSDGKKVSVARFTVTMARNDAQFEVSNLRMTEGVESEDIYTDNVDDLCDVPDLTSYGAEGEKIYPFPVVISLSAPSESRVIFDIQLITKYDEDESETDKANIRYTRPGRDYVSGTKQIVFKPGVTRCLITLDVYDDYLIEGQEEMVIDSALVEGWVVLPRSISGTMIDNEPQLIFAGGTEYLSEGKTTGDYTFELSESVDYELSVNLELGTGSTVQDEDYQFNPAIIVFPKNTTESSFTVSILDDGDNDVTAVKNDEVLIVDADVSKIFKLESLNITINEWSSNKLTANSDDGAESNSMGVDGDGFVAVLNTELSGGVGPNTDSVILFFDRAGNSTAFTRNLADSIITSATGNETSIKLLVNKRSNLREIFVVLNTDSVVEGAGFGGSDIVVRKYSRIFNDDFYSITWTKQFGSTGDDLATGISVDDKGNLYVYGTTDNSIKSGVINVGAKDAFIYVLDVIGDEVWSGMQGSLNDDIPSGVVISDEFVYLYGSTSGVLGGVSFGGVDSFEAVYKLDGSFQSIRQWGTIFDDYTSDVARMKVSIPFSSKFNTQRWLAGYTQGDLTNNNGVDFNVSAERGSIDGSFLNYEAPSDLVGALMYGDTTVPDRALAIAIAQGLNGGASRGILGGDTQGVLSGELSSGGLDATLLAVESDDELSQVAWRSQFGTAGDDTLIDVAIHGDKKIMALWKASAGNSLFYITPFKVADGAKLVD